MVEAQMIDLGRIRVHELLCGDKSHEYDNSKRAGMSATRTGTTASSGMRRKRMGRRRVGRILRTMFGQDADGACSRCNLLLKGLPSPRAQEEALQ